MPARPRVAHVGPDSRGGGGMSAVVRGLLASPLIDRYELDAISTHRPVGRGRRAAIFAGGTIALTRWCRGPGPRLVHVHSAVRGSLYRKSLLVLLVRALRRPVILHVHAGAGDIDAFAARLGPMRRWGFGAVMGRADRVLSVSAAGARRLEHHFGVRGIAVVPNAAPQVPKLMETQAQVPLTLLYLGGFEDPAKGGEILLAALPTILDEHPGLSVVLAGPGRAPRALTDMLGNGNRVRWAGWLAGSDKDTALARDGIVVFPSISEGLPVALLEAMAHGRAIVASRVGGMPEVLTDGTDGLLVPARDAGALSDAIGALVTDRERRDRLGAAARARAERLNADEVCGRLDDVYRKLLA